VTRRRGRRRKKLLDDRNEKRGYWKLKEETQNRTMWRANFGRECIQIYDQTCVPLPAFIIIIIIIIIMSIQSFQALFLRSFIKVDEHG